MGCSDIQKTNTLNYIAQTSLWNTIQQGSTRIIAQAGVIGTEIIGDVYLGAQASLGHNQISGRATCSTQASLWGGNTVNGDAYVMAQGSLFYKNNISGNATWATQAVLLGINKIGGTAVHTVQVSLGVNFVGADLTQFSAQIGPVNMAQNLKQSIQIGFYCQAKSLNRSAQLCLLSSGNITGGPSLQVGIRTDQKSKLNIFSLGF